MAPSRKEQSQQSTVRRWSAMCWARDSPQGVGPYASAWREQFAAAALNTPARTPH
ncbi:hypothetical protein ACFXCZ_18735 [Streptomyces sp. NPDC059396]|uniref:hypothetical protein n=1 Tax=Streptomyces sp. NPDC059396 TaxID=3346819 RepID=UPI00368B243B